MKLGLYHFTATSFSGLVRDDIVLVFGVTDHKNTLITVHLLTPSGEVMNWMVSRKLFSCYCREGLW